MRELDSDLERREHRRNRPHTPCEILVGARRYDGTIEDLSRGGLFVRTDADTGRGAVIRVRWEGDERFAVVVHQRNVAASLRWLISGGLGLRWTRTDWT
jgi:hypothetical protein